MQGLDGRHRDKDGEIEKKHGNTKMKNLQGHYSVLNQFRGSTRLGSVEKRYGVDSLDGLIKKLTASKKRGN